MATSVNKVQLIGNMTRDPDVRDLQGGDKVASFNVATNESWTNKTTGERQEKTEFHTVVVFNQALVGIVADHYRKGMKVYVEGAMSTRKFTDRDGNERTTTEVVLTRGRGELMIMSDRDKSTAQGAGGSQARAEAPSADAAPNFDDVPF